MFCMVCSHFSHFCTFALQSASNKYLKERHPLSTAKFDKYFAKSWNGVRYRLQVSIIHWQESAYEALSVKTRYKPCIGPGAQPQAKKLRGGGARFGSQHRGVICASSHAKPDRPAVGCGRGSPAPPAVRVRGITPGKFLKTQMLNPAFWWLFSVKFLAFWKLQPRSWGEIHHRSRIRYLSKKNSQILTNFPKLKTIRKYSYKNSLNARVGVAFQWWNSLLI